MKAVILAGGKGTRLGTMTRDIPKPLIPIEGMPILEHQINCLKQQGIEEFWLLTGHLGQQIEDYFGDGSNWDIQINYYCEESPQGTAGALMALKPHLSEPFFLTSGDIMFNFDLERLTKFHLQCSDSIATIIVHPNDHPADSDLVEIDERGKVIELLIRPHRENLLFQNLSIASAYMFSPEIFDYIPNSRPVNIEQHLFPVLLEAQKGLYAYNTPEYFKDMGTPKRLEKVTRDFLKGKVAQQTLKQPQKAIFLDRDGVINSYVPHLNRVEDFQLLPFTPEAIRQINQTDYLAIVVTNQPMLAKGMLSAEGLHNIHKKLETELGLQGLKLDGIFYCPHHPERGFEGEIAELKIECDCRKPAIGMIEQAALRYNLDLSQCYFIGDTTRDAKTAENAGLSFKGVATGHGCQDGEFQLGTPLSVYENILEAIQSIVMS